MFWFDVWSEKNYKKIAFQIWNVFGFMSVNNPHSVLHMNEHNVIQKFGVYWTVFIHGYDSKNSILLLIIVTFLLDDIIHSGVWRKKQKFQLSGSQQLAHNFRIEIANLSKYFHRKDNFGFRCVLKLNIHIRIILDRGSSRAQNCRWTRAHRESYAAWTMFMEARIIAYVMIK